MYRTKNLQELADLIKTHCIHVCRYERDLTAPFIDVVIREVFDVNTDTLI